MHRWVASLAHRQVLETRTRATVTIRPRHLVNEQARRQILIRQDFHCGRLTCGDGNETFWKVNGNKKLQHTTKPNKRQDTARTKQTNNFSQLELMSEFSVR